MDLERDKLNILDVRFISVSVERVLTLFEDMIESDRKESVYFINADCLNISSHDVRYRRILNSQGLVLPDGIGISMACRMVGERMVANLNGTDLLPHICDLCQDRGYSVFLLGAAPSVAHRMQENLREKWPGLDVCGEQHGYFDPKTEIDDVLERINQAKPNIVLVAFGAPFQEKWIDQHRHRLQANLLMGVGGLFDFYSGDKKRAPMWMRNNGLEWAYRLYLEPARMWRRYILGNPLFIYRVFKWKQTLRR